MCRHHGFGGVDYVDCGDFYLNDRNTDWAIMMAAALVGNLLAVLDVEGKGSVFGIRDFLLHVPIEGEGRE